MNQFFCAAVGRL